MKSRFYFTNWLDLKSQRRIKNQMEEIRIFENPEFGFIRAVEKDGEPWFVGKDVADTLGYQNGSRDINRHVDDEDRHKVMLFDGKQLKETIVINESGLYSLILSSKLPAAKAFKRWVTSEVLPSIRKTGGYLEGQESMSDADLLAKALLVAQKQIEQRDKRIKEVQAANSDLTVKNQIMQPKADYFDELVDRNLLTNFRDTAKQLGVKQNTFVKFLLDRKYLYRDKHGNLKPYAAHATNGLFEVRESVNEKTGWAGTQTLVTPKGRETFRLLHVAG